MDSRRDVWREVAVLAVTGVACLGLLGAGVFFWQSGGLAGEAALARLSGELAQAVTTEWEQLRREPSWIEGDRQVWSVTPGPGPVAPHAWPNEEPNLVVEALLLEAQRLRTSEGEAPRALELLRDLMKKDPTPGQRARARLRIIQLAVELDEPELAREALAETRAALKGSETLEGDSLLLLSGLAAAPALDAPEALALREDLVHRWHAGQLALPSQTLAGQPLRAAYAQALQDLATGQPPDPRLVQAERAEHARLLAEALGQPLPLPEGSGLGVQVIGKEELVYRRRGPDLLEGRLHPAGSCAAALAQRVERAGVLPGGFLLDVGPGEPVAGTLVRDWTALEPLPRGFRLLHENPEEFAAEVEGRQRLLSSGFFALALGLLGVGVMLTRSIRRERNLARLKSLFIANVSHELRTPVASILLMAENLELDRVPDAAGRLRYHRLIRREADRLRRLVNDVLDFSRIDRGKALSMAKGDLDLAEFARELEEEARARATGRGAELEFRVDASVKVVHADGEALRRAVMNLVENALRHSGESKVTVQLSADQAKGLCLRVLDEGKGVPPQRLANLFEPFERVEEPRTNGTVAAGTGLGLAIVREIAESHGGRVTAHNRSPKGFAVEIRIPLESKEEQQS